jgi:protocatechuate 3,4-dioxygenase beta subunit
VEKEKVKLEDAKTTDLGTIVVREGRSISGHVTDASGEAVPDATVTAFWNDGARSKNRDARTRTDGRYRLAGLEEGPIGMLVVRAKGFARAEREGAVPGDRAVDFVLERTGSIVGRVLAPGGKTPAAFRIVAHAEAKEAAGNPWRRLGGTDPGPGEQVFTDPGGAFRLDDVDPGTYTLEAIAEHYAPAKRAGLEVRGDGVTDAGTLELEPGITLRGRVLDRRDETPIAGAVVRVETPQTMPFRADPAAIAKGNTLSATDGAFTIDGLQAGAFSVAVEHPDFSPAHLRVELDARQDPPELVARLSRGGTLTGAVRNAQREGIADARILVTQGMGGEDARTISTGADGRYLVERLAPGGYQVVRQAAEGRGMGAGFGMKSATIREGETTTVDFDDASRITLVGRVLRGATPPPDTVVLFRLGDAPGVPGEAKSTQSDAEGVYRIGLDLPGTYQATLQTGGALAVRGLSSIRVVVPDQAEFQYDLVLPESSISGRVTDVEGKPVSSALLSAVRDGAAANEPSRQLLGQSDSEGVYHLDGAQPGTYHVTARASGFRMGDKHPVVVDDTNPSPTVDFQLEAGRLLRGRLLDPQGQGISNGMIFIADVD